ncbi:MAG: hypothetical protein IPG97_02475 [Microthrixaceae bacterium]|nr:hypothetical protein [Microthrixaceae bacterium]
MVIVDANVLLYAVNEDTIHHRAARTWLDDALAGNSGVGFAWLVLVAFMRVSTNTRIMPTPLSVDEAIEQVEAWLACPAATAAAEPLSRAQRCISSTTSTSPLIRRETSSARRRNTMFTAPCTSTSSRPTKSLTRSSPASMASSSAGTSSHGNVSQIALAAGFKVTNSRDEGSKSTLESPSDTSTKPDLGATVIVAGQSGSTGPRLAEVAPSSDDSVCRAGEHSEGVRIGRHSFTSQGVPGILGGLATRSRITGTASHASP